MSSFAPPGDCPVCGEFVPEGDTSCKECGSCPKSGWNEDVAYDGLDLPMDEHEENASKKKSDAKRLAMAAGLLLIVIVLYILTKP